MAPYDKDRLTKMEDHGLEARIFSLSERRTRNQDMRDAEFAKQLKIVAKQERTANTAARTARVAALVAGIAAAVTIVLAIAGIAWLLLAR